MRSLLAVLFAVVALSAIAAAQTNVVYVARARLIPSRRSLSGASADAWLYYAEPHAGAAPSSPSLFIYVNATGLASANGRYVAAVLDERGKDVRRADPAGSGRVR